MSERLSLPILKFDPSFPAQHEAEIRKLLLPLLDIVRELHDVRISFGDVEGQAAVEPARRYHTAYVKLDESFFTLDLADKRHVLLHEMMHVKVDVFAREAMHVLETWAPDGAQTYATKRLADAEEMLVDDLARIFLLLLPPAVEASIFPKPPAPRTPGDRS